MKIGKVISVKILAWITGPLTIIATILGLVNDVPGALGLFSNHSGSVALSYKGEKVENVGERHVIICLDRANSVSNLTNIFPTLSNNTSYGVNNFSMRYNLESQGVAFEPTDFYVFTPEDDRGAVLKYKENLLPAFTTVDKPIRKFSLDESGGKLKLSAHASYDGIENPIVYNVLAYFYVEPYSSLMNYDEWKLKCQRKFLPDTRGFKECDVYYLTQSKGLEQEIKVNLAALTQNDAANKMPTARQQTRRQHTATSNPTKATSSTSQSATSRQSHINQSCQPFSLRIERVEKSDGVFLSASVENPSCDTTFLMLVLLEDTVTNEKSNLLWHVYAKQQYKQNNLLSLSNHNNRLIDYGFCKEIKSFGDSLTISNDSVVVNNTLRTIGVYTHNNLGHWISQSYLRPNASGEWNSKIDLKSYPNCTFSYYDLPEELLIDEYRQVDEYRWLKDGIYDSFLVACMLAMLLILPWLFIIISEVFSKKIKRFSDFKLAYVSFCWDDFHTDNFFHLLWKQFLLFILAFIGLFSLFLIVELVAHYI